MKSYQYRSLDISEIHDTALWLLRSCFWPTTSWLGVINQLHEPWNYGARDACSFCVFRSFFKNLKSSFTEDNMPEHALDIFLENATKMI